MFAVIWLWTLVIICELQFTRCVSTSRFIYELLVKNIRLQRAANTPRGFILFIRCLPFAVWYIGLGVTWKADTLLMKPMEIFVLLKNANYCLWRIKQQGCDFEIEAGNKIDFYFVSIYLCELSITLPWMCLHRRPCSHCMDRQRDTSVKMVSRVYLITKQYRDAYNWKSCYKSTLTDNSSTLCSFKEKRF